MVQPLKTSVVTDIRGTAVAVHQNDGIAVPMAKAVDEAFNNDSIAKTATTSLLAMGSLLLAGTVLYIGNQVTSSRVVQARTPAASGVLL
jgi:hypothetical protein